MIQKDFPIGTKVVVNKVCVKTKHYWEDKKDVGRGQFYYVRKQLKRVEKESVFPFDGVVCGVKRLFEGSVVAVENCCERFLDVSGSVLVICVRRGLLNKEIYVPVDGLYKVADRYKDQVSIPVFQGDWSNSRTEEFRRVARDLAREQKRDSLGRFVKC